MRISKRNEGLFLVLISALVFSTAGIFTKSIEAAAWDIIFWRGVFATLFTVAYVSFKGKFAKEFNQMGKWGLIAAIAGALGTAAFIPAFKHTDIANVALIYSAAPLVAAFYAWVWISEKPTNRVLLGAVLALIGVALIVGGSLNSINLKGDLLALLMTLAMAYMIVIYRRFPEVPAAGPAAVSCVLLLPPAMLFGSPFENQIGEIAAMAVFGLVFAVASITLLEGARRLPSAETALLSTLEAPFAILLAWLIFAQVPVWTTVLGGLLIITAILNSQRA
ncbi:MAG: EamA family transporter [Pseudomonadota bacterium]